MNCPNGQDNQVSVLQQRVNEGAQFIRNHSFSAKARKGCWSAQQRLAYTVIQYGFAVVWPGFLGAVADRSSVPELRKAFKENALCEVGMFDTGHVFLARQFAVSQGITPAELERWPDSDLSRQSMTRMFALVDDDADEAWTAGYLYAQETLAGIMFETALPAFKKIPGCATKYMEVHVEVDGDTHGPMILQGVQKLLDLQPESFPKVMAGVEAAISARVDYMEYIMGINP